MAEQVSLASSLRRKAVYDVLLGVVLGNDRELEALEAASLP
jgi:hypothetical protein